MATYFHGNSEIQGGGGDGLQTLILMNPAAGSYVGYSSDTQPQHQGSNFVFLNSSNTPGGSGTAAAAGGGGGGQGGSTISFSHAPPPPHSQQQFVGIPLATATASSQDPHHDMSALHGFFPRMQYNLYNPNMDLGAARDVTRSQQGLSLSLSSQQPAYGSFRPPDRPEVAPSQPLVTTTISPTSVDDVRVSGGSSSSASGVSNGVNGMQSVLLSSKYLKAAQELLDEVVSVGRGVKSGGESAASKVANGMTAKNTGETSVAAAASGDGLSGGGEGSGKRGADLTTAERQEIQMKKAKLVNMLDEVEQRYRQYHHQMQIVISWFEQAAGIGSAKTYTALALQTISKQFRCLKDAIMGQIKAASKSLGEEENLGGKIEGSRLKFVDNQLRQQRALQQLGMIQHNAWRPQRGLPERSVSVLRAWLFEHFLHPYPKDSDKIMLAKQTGLTRSQVSNWFINARVRLWKPMVEEMYMEEIKEQEQNGSEEKMNKSDRNEDSAALKSSSMPEKSTGSENQNKSFISKQDNSTNQNSGQAISMSAASTSPTGINIRNQSAGFNLIGSSDIESFTQGSPKKPRSNNEMLHSPGSVPSVSMEAKQTNNPGSDQISIKFGNDRQSRDGFTLMGAPTNIMGGFNSYSIGEIGRFNAEQFPSYSGNGVSLTLGLPHCENLSMSGAHQTFMPNQSMQLGRGVEMGEANEFGSIDTPTSAHSTSVYDNINLQNRKRFAAAQLLPDYFVA